MFGLQVLGFGVSGLGVKCLGLGFRGDTSGFTVWLALPPSTESLRSIHRYYSSLRAGFRSPKKKENKKLGKAPFKAASKFRGWHHSYIFLCFGVLPQIPSGIHNKRISSIFPHVSQGDPRVQVFGAVSRCLTAKSRA